MEEMDYNILFRWFVGLNLDDPVWDATVFSKNRDRLLEAEVAKEFLARVVGQARAKGWIRVRTGAALNLVFMDVSRWDGLP
jgi:transposase